VMFLCELEAWVMSSWCVGTSNLPIQTMATVLLNNLQRRRFE
jgi:hypothetical protein